ncbi:MAG: hypothetical protein Faunusvirus9_7 [Faunusvirus sp.]|jgi:hypothetical protein|uniref:BTB domain-containing protein n=1 Tax=Faunusvirus sp. TaxID=2487766 RepID=A0A3G5A1F3_9VIRU|nr:MAG: hypothetical protein Faunusvirus9_7 [Faunusvirus sp.]
MDSLDDIQLANTQVIDESTSISREIIIVVNNKPFTCNVANLCKNQPYFNARINGKFQEASLTTIELEFEEEFNGNAIYAIFKYLQSTETTKLNIFDTLHILKDLYHGYVFMEYIQDTAAMDYFNQRITDYLKIQTEIDECRLLLLINLISRFKLFTFDTIFRNNKMLIDQNYIQLKAGITNRYSDVNPEIILDLHTSWASNLILNSKCNDLVALNVFNFTKYLKYTPPNEDCILNNNIKYKTDESVIVSNISEYQQRLKEFSFGIIDETLKFENIVIAGGSVVKLLSNKYDAAGDSDLDIFVYGTEKARRQTVEYLLDYFTTKCHGKQIYYASRGSVISVCIEDVNRNFQIIYTDHMTKFEIINGFDMCAVQMYYDGTNIMGTAECIRELRQQCIYNTTARDIRPDRIYKMYLKGFSVSKRIINDIVNDITALSVVDIKTKSNIKDKDAETDKMDEIIMGDKVDSLNTINTTDDLIKIMHQFAQREFVYRTSNKYYYPIKEIDQARNMFLMKLVFNAKDVTQDKTELLQKFNFTGYKTDPYANNTKMTVLQNGLTNKLKKIDIIPTKRKYNTMSGYLFARPIEIITDVVPIVLESETILKKDGFRYEFADKYKTSDYKLQYGSSWKVQRCTISYKDTNLQSQMQQFDNVLFPIISKFVKQHANSQRINFCGLGRQIKDTSGNDEVEIGELNTLQCTSAKLYNSTIKWQNYNKKTLTDDTKNFNAKLHIIIRGFYVTADKSGPFHMPNIYLDKNITEMTIYNDNYVINKNSGFTFDISDGNTQCESDESSGDLGVEDIADISNTADTHQINEEIDIDD